MSNKGSATNVLFQLQQWYLQQCDGDWEHSYGVKIDTLDNPGWIVTVDLSGTALAGLKIPRTRSDRSEDDWAQHEVLNDRFVACGGPLNLEELVERFLAIAIAR